MQIVRFRIDGKTRYGVLDGAAVVEYAGTPWSLFRRGRRRYSLRQVVLLAPVLPSKIVGVGLNHGGLGGAAPNGTLRASASTTGLAFAVEDVLARVSEIMTLLPGDVVATGAPGVSGPVDAGDRVEIRIGGVGALKNTVVRL